MAHCVWDFAKNRKRKFSNNKTLVGFPNMCIYIVMYMYVPRDHALVNCLGPLGRRRVLVNSGQEETALAPTTPTPSSRESATRDVCHKGLLTKTCVIKLRSRKFYGKVW